MTATQAIYFLTIQTIAVVLATIGIVATIIWNRNLVRRRATIDLLVADQTNETLLKARMDFVAASADDGLLKAIKDGIWSSEKYFFASTCNRYEILAIGIKEGIIDERIYKSYWRGTLLADWKRVETAVHYMRNRQQNPKIYIEFEDLARKWSP
jgi:hypothetical protein